MLCAPSSMREPMFEARASDGRSVLMVAAEFAAYGAVETLLRFGADLRPRDSRGRDVFDLASVSGNCDLMALLDQFRRARSMAICTV